MRQQFDTSQHTTVRVEIGAGAVQVSAGEQSHVLLEVTGPRAEEFTADQDGDRIVVSGPRQRIGFLGTTSTHQVALQVPAGTDLDIRCGSADLRATGTFGKCQVKTGAGEIRLGRVGHAILEAGSGDIRVDSVGADLRVKVGSGDVTVGEVAGTAVASAGSGSVRIGSLGGAAAMKAGSGELSIDDAGPEVNLRTGSGDLSVARMARGRFTARSASGDVAIGIPSGTPVWTDINTVSGRVRSSLPAVGAPKPGQDSVEVRITTTSGDITLQPL